MHDLAIGTAQPLSSLSLTLVTSAGTGPDPWDPATCPGELREAVWEWVRPGRSLAQSRIRVAADADDAGALRQVAADVAGVHRGQELAHRKVAAAAKENEVEIVKSHSVVIAKKVETAWMMPLSLARWRTQGRARNRAPLVHRVNLLHKYADRKKFYYELAFG